MKEIFTQEQNNILQTYNRLPIAIDKAEGCYIWVQEGDKYIDFISGIGVNILGYNHPSVNTAITQQLQRYSHTSNYFYQDIQIEFAKKLNHICGTSKVFFCNSGTEAIEGALKMCRKWGSGRGKSEVVSFTGNFHGRTYGALSLMDKPQYKNKMNPFLQGINIAKYNDIESLKTNVSNKTAAVFLEFIQGENGIIAADDAFIFELIKLQRQHNFLLVADEIQTGMGRTGEFTAWQHYSFLKPNITTMAKGLGGGIPLGAILVDEKLENIFEKGEHGTTFGGNPLACAAGTAVINELFDNKIIYRAMNMGNLFLTSLELLQKEFPNIIKEVRGLGLMLGIELNQKARPIVDNLLKKHNVIANATAENVIRLLPPLIITEKEMEIFINALRQCLQQLN